MMILGQAPRAPFSMGSDPCFIRLLGLTPNFENGARGVRPTSAKCEVIFARSLSIPFCLAEEFDHRRITVIEEEAQARIKGHYRIHIRRIEFKTKHVEVLRHSFFPDRSEERRVGKECSFRWLMYWY